MAAHASVPVLSSQSPRTGWRSALPLLALLALKANFACTPRV